MKRGFTILEVIIAIFILTVAVGGSFVLIQQTLIAASLAESRLTAHYLAQEGIEIVRNIRDSNWLRQRAGESGIDWDENLAEGLSIGDPAGEYTVDYHDAGLNDSGDGSLYLYDGFYSHDVSDESTPFIRKIIIEKLDLPETSYFDDYKLKVTARVQWSERGRDHKIEVSEYLYNWGE